MISWVVVWVVVRGYGDGIQEDTVMKRRKHRNDKNHGKNGWVSGNPRYNRHRKTTQKKDRSMGKN
jgi:hypothetical protein